MSHSYVTTRVAILASASAAPADVYLANQVIRAHDVPLILVQQPRRTTLRKRLGKLLSRSPATLLDRLLNRRFEAERQRRLSDELATRFATLGGAHAYEPGPRIVRVDDIHSPATLDLLRQAGANTLLQNGAGIIRAPLIRAFPGRILNVHHGWLPAIRGCHSIAWGLLEGRPEWIGVSVHLIDEGLDTGPILARERLPVSPDDTYASLFFAATVAGGRLLAETLRSLEAGSCVPIPRDEPGKYRPAMTRCDWLALQSRSFRPELVNPTNLPPQPGAINP